METLAVRVESLRLGRGLSKEALARSAGVTARTLFSIETGRTRNPTAPLVKRLAGALGVGTEVLAPAPETVGGRLVRARRRRGMSQGELASRAGLGLVTVNQVERGKRPRPRAATRRRLAKALRMAEADLFG